MAILLTQQRRPLTLEETGDDDALSSRLYARLAQNVNNLKGYCARSPLILQHWPGGLTWSDSLGQSIQWPKMNIPPGYRNLRFVIGWLRSSGAGTLTARVYLRHDLQAGIPTDADYSATVTTTSATHVFTAGTISDIVLFTNVGSFAFLRLTATVNPTQARAYTFKAWPEI